MQQTENLPTPPRPEGQEIVSQVCTDPSGDSGCITFAIHGEDHTLGNMIRHILMQNPDVDFAGYTIPHPSENKIHVRIQTKEGSGVTAYQALRKALEDAESIISEIYYTFKTEVRNAEERGVVSLE